MPTKRKAQTVGVTQLASMIPDEYAAVALMEAILWGPEPLCPRCGNEKVHEARRDYHFWCGQCRIHFTVRTNTMMATSNLPIRKWFFAMYFLVTARKGVSSLQLSKELSISQKAAWFLLHRLREACASGPGLLSGQVEIDETFLGGKEGNKHENKRLRTKGGVEGKAIVMGFRERGGRTVGRHVSSVDRLTLWTEIQKTVAKGVRSLYRRTPLLCGDRT